MVNEELDCSGGSSSDIDDPAESSAILTAAICSSTGLNTDRVCLYIIISILLYKSKIILLSLLINFRMKIINLLECFLNSLNMQKKC